MENRAYLSAVSSFHHQGQIRRQSTAVGGSSCFFICVSAREVIRQLFFFSLPSAKASKETMHTRLPCRVAGTWHPCHPARPLLLLLPLFLSPHLRCVTRQPNFCTRRIACYGMRSRPLYILGSHDGCYHLSRQWCCLSKNRESKRFYLA